MFNTNVVLSKTFRPILVSDQLPRSAADLTSHVCIQGGFFPIDRCLHLWREGLRELGGVDAIFLFRLVFALRLQGWHIFGYKKKGVQVEGTWNCLRIAASNADVPQQPRCAWVAPSKHAGPTRRTRYEFIVTKRLSKRHTLWFTVRDMLPNDQ